MQTQPNPTQITSSIATRSTYVMMLYCISLISLIYTTFARPIQSKHTNLKNDATEELPSHQTTLVPNSCLNHENDDTVIVKLLDEASYPLISTKCRNQYMIVDLEQDSLWHKYFVSTRTYHYNLVGPEKDDHVNWQQWMIPEMENFLVSPDCNTCDPDHELNVKYSTNSGIYKHKNT